MKATKELKKLDDRRSLVQITYGDGSHEYCVCSYYDESRPIGSRWDWGHYFETIEKAMDYAVRTA